MSIYLRISCCVFSFLSYHPLYFSNIWFLTTFSIRLLLSYIIRPYSYHEEYGIFTGITFLQKRRIIL